MEIFYLCCDVVGVVGGICGVVAMVMMSNKK